MEPTPYATNFYLWAILVCQVFLGDLIPKGEKFGSKQDENGYLPKGEQLWFQRGRKQRRSSKYGEKQKGMMDLGGGQVIIGWW